MFEAVKKLFNNPVVLLVILSLFTGIGCDDETKHRVEASQNPEVTNTFNTLAIFEPVRRRTWGSYIHDSYVEEIKIDDHAYLIWKDSIIHSQSCTNHLKLNNGDEVKFGI